MVELENPRRRWPIRLLIGFVVLAAVAAGGYYMKLPRNPIPPEVSSQVKFPLYYPAKLPQGYNLDKSSFRGTSQVVFYQAVSSGGAQKIFFSLQPRPADFNFDDFYFKKLSDTTDITTPNGKATIGVYNQGIFGSLVTTKTWVIVTSTDETAQSQVQEILKNMTGASS
jgi:hypothetical protein